MIEVVVVGEWRGEEGGDRMYYIPILIPIRMSVSVFAFITHEAKTRCRK